jgi:hypothetical protein
LERRLSELEDLLVRREKEGEEEERAMAKEIEDLLLLEKELQHAVEVKEEEPDVGLGLIMDEMEEAEEKKISAMRETWALRTNTMLKNVCVESLLSYVCVFLYACV